MGRRRERSRKSDVSCEPSAAATSTLGTSLLAGPSTPRIPFVNNPLGSLLSSACSVSSHLCSLGTGNHQMYLQWITGSERVLDEAHHHLRRAMGRRKLTADLRRSDSPPYQPGQKVWLSTWDIRLLLPCKKLAPRYVGPFVIQKQINPVTFQLKLPSQYRIHPTFHVSLLKPYHSPVSPSTEPGPITEPLILEDGAVYKVRTILDSQCHGGRLEYLVDWEGYGPEERSWIPRDDILDPDLMVEFHLNFPNRPNQS